MQKLLSSLFLVIFSLIAGIQITGQILGFLGIYYFWSALITSIILSTILFFWIRKTSLFFLENISEQGDPSQKNKLINISGYCAGAALIFVLILLPLILWPYSGINDELTWDAGLYHLPKAAELVVNHSTWDLSIDYGEYPWGYESLITFSLLFSRSGMLIGVIHAIITMLFLLSFFFLAARFSSLPRGLLFFVIAIIICSFDIVRKFDSNPWWIFRILAFTIGKNDFHLTATLTSLLMFTPFRTRHKTVEYSLPGIAVASALVLSTKPNGALIVALIGIVAFIYEIRKTPLQKINIKEFIANWLPLALVFLSGLLWALRNLFMTGRLVSKEAFEIQQWSILNNLTNPFFYEHMDIYFKYFMVIVILTLIFTIFSKRFHWSILAVLLACSFSFIATPASGFFGSNQVPTLIAWRFGAYLVAFEVVVVLLMVDPIANWFFKKPLRLITILVSVGMLIVAAYSGYQNYSRILPQNENTIVLRDIYRTPVGVNGYFSAYDYVQQNIHDSVVWVENGFPFYVFGKDLTNTVTRTRPADFMVFFQTQLIDEGGYPSEINSEAWNEAWLLVYEDLEGRVYQRK